MSETKRLEASRLAAGTVSGYRVGGALVYNENPYPVEVTVRRVAEKVAFEAELIAATGYGFVISGYAERAATRDKGFRDGQRVRVTIEPLDE